MNHTRRSRVLSLILTVVMAVSLLPAVSLTASAADSVLPTAGGTLSGGTYYLNANKTLSSNLTITGTVKLYLNGYVLKGNGSGTVITVGSGGRLELYDAYSSGYATDKYHSFSTQNRTINSKSTTCYTYASSASAAPASGVYVEGGVVTGGAATQNGLNHGGGVRICPGGTFLMYGGSIAGNYATDHGGGVAVKMNNESGTATFEQHGGAVCYNTSNWGGGISIYSNATIIAGETCGNIAVSGGGGVELESGGKLYMRGGSVTGNRITKADGSMWKAGGVHVPSRSEFHIQGTVRIQNNYQGASGTTQNNVFLRNNMKITVDGAIDGSAMGVGTEAKPSGGSTVTLTTNLKAKGSSNIGVFSSDDPAYSVIWNSARSEAVLGNQGTVTFYSDMAGAHPIGNTKTYNIGTALGSVTKPADQSKSGYWFAGWTTVKAADTETGYSYKQAMPDAGKSAEDRALYPCILTDFASGTVTGEMQFYPLFIKDRLNVILERGDDELTPATMGTGSDGNPQAISFTVNIDEPIRMTGLLGTTRVGYTLDGWYTAKGVKWNPGATAAESSWWRMTPEYADSSTPVKHTERPYNYYTVTLTAHWTPKTVTVRYDKGEHPADETPIADGSTALGGTLVLPPAPAADAQHKFTGWKIGTGETLYSAGATLTFNDWSLVTGGDSAPVLTVTAQYVNDSASINFDTNGGTAIAPITGKKGETITIPEDVKNGQRVTKEGHTFVCWCTDAALSHQVTESEWPTVLTEENAVYYAKWSVNQYSIYFIMNDATSAQIDPITQNYGAAVTAPADPVRTHYDFRGWSPALPGKMPAKDLTVEAVWEPVKYSMCFYTTAADASPALVEGFYGALVQPPKDPTAENLTFAEWSLPTPIYMPDTNPTVTAKWKPNPTVAGETIFGKADGVLSGVTDEMVYRPVGAADWTDITGETVENLPAGDYEVKFKEPGAYKSDAITVVTVPSGEPILGNIKVVSGTAEGTVVEDAAVRLYQGSTAGEPKAELTYDGESGMYPIKRVADGDYTVVVQKDGKTVTGKILVSSSDPEDIVIVIPAGDLSSVLDIKASPGAPDVSGTVVGGLDAVAAGEAPAGAEEVEIKLTVEGKADLTQTADAELSAEQKKEKSAQQAVKTLGQTATGTTTVLSFIDMGIFKTVTVGGSEPTVTPIYSTGSNVLEIILPFETRGRFNFGVYRRHVAEDGTITDKIFTRLSERPLGGFEDGTFFVGDGFIVIYASKFSTYAIGYTPTEQITPLTPSVPTVSGGVVVRTTYPVTIGGTENGTVTADKEKAAKDETVVLTVTPREGYTLTGIKVVDDGNREIPLTANADGSYSFKMPAGTVSVVAQFRRYRATPEETGVAGWLITDEHISYISGYPDGTASPQGNITRAETAMIFYRLLRDPNVAVTVSFPDVAPDAWYAGAVNVLGSLGILQGRTDGSFDGGAKITRAEFAAIAARFAETAGGKNVFSDVPENYWAYGSIAAASAFGWIEGYPDGTFLPQGDITRAEAAAIVNRMLGRAADEAYILANPEKLTQFPDLQDPNAWYYPDMVEATNRHDFTFVDGAETWK